MNLQQIAETAGFWISAFFVFVAAVFIIGLVGMYVCVGVSTLWHYLTVQRPVGKRTRAAYAAGFTQRWGVYTADGGYHFGYIIPGSDDGKTAGEVRYMDPASGRIETVTVGNARDRRKASRRSLGLEW